MMTTAKEFIKSKSDEYKIDRDLVEDMLIDFAKFHIESALKYAAEKAVTDNDYQYDQDTASEFEVIFVDKQSILNAYPITNIK